MKRIVFFSVLVLALLCSCEGRRDNSAILLTDNSVEWEASWIGVTSSEDVRTGDVSLPARYLRTTFNSRGGIKEARLHICGLGLYEAYINGTKVGGAQVLSPTVSNYDKVVYYNSFDVSSLIHKGDNAIAVALGTGRVPGVRVQWDGLNSYKHYDKMLPCLLCQIEITYSDGEIRKILSDQTWKATAEGPIRSNNEYDGEIYDARREFDGWLLSSYDDSAC